MKQEVPDDYSLFGRKQWKLRILAALPQLFDKPALVRSVPATFRAIHEHAWFDKFCEACGSTLPDNCIGRECAHCGAVIFPRPVTVKTIAEFSGYCFRNGECRTITRALNAIRNAGESRSGDAEEFLTMQRRPGNDYRDGRYYWINWGNLDSALAERRAAASHGYRHTGTPSGCGRGHRDSATRETPSGCGRGHRASSGEPPDMEEKPPDMVTVPTRHHVGSPPDMMSGALYTSFYSPSPPARGGSFEDWSQARRRLVGAGVLAVDAAISGAQSRGVPPALVIAVIDFAESRPG